MTLFFSFKHENAKKAGERNGTRSIPSMRAPAACKSMQGLSPHVSLTFSGSYSSLIPGVNTHICMCTCIRSTEYTHTHAPRPHQVVGAAGQPAQGPTDGHGQSCSAGRKAHILLLVGYNASSLSLSLHVVPTAEGGALVSGEARREEYRAQKKKRNSNLSVTGLHASPPTYLRKEEGGMARERGGGRPKRCPRPAKHGNVPLWLLQVSSLISDEAS
ncbi:hypothetical protein IF2G_02956 [Cordyceps javanica]|nr:hypothetical protein IF2G_02956 [Cordyceps javanica]